MSLQRGGLCGEINGKLPLDGFTLTTRPRYGQKRVQWELPLSEPLTVTLSSVRADFTGASRGSSGAHIVLFLVPGEPAQVKKSRSRVASF